MPPVPVKPKEVTKQDIVNDTEEDYEFAREKLKALIKTSEDGIDAMMGLVRETEHPRAGEVLGGLIKTAGDAVGQLMDLQRKRKDLTQDKETKVSEPGGVNNIKKAIFIGSTTDLQKALADDLEEPKNVTDV